MRKFRRTKMILTMVAMAFFGTSMLVMAPMSAMAQNTEGNAGNFYFIDNCKVEFNEKSKARPIQVQFNLPGVTKKIPLTTINNKGDEVKVLDSDKNQKYIYQVKNLPCYIIGIYIYFAGVAGILATTMMMYGGIKYIISAGNPAKIADAKDQIYSAMVGLILTLGSYTLLNFINPNMIDLRLEGIDTIDPIYQDVPWCPGPNADPPIDVDPVEAGEKGCGKKGIRLDNGKECVYDNCGEKDKMCISDKQNEDKFLCDSIQAICNGASTSECSTVDELIQRKSQLGNKSTKVCALQDGKGPGCVYTDLVDCKSETSLYTWYRTSCSTGRYEESTGQETQCWSNEDGEPKDECVSSPQRAGAGESSVCCKDDKDVDCRDQTDHDGNGCDPGEEIQVRCEEYPRNDPDTGNLIRPDSCSPTEISNGRLCCMEIDTQSGKFYGFYDNPQD